MWFGGYAVSRKMWIFEQFAQFIWHDPLAKPLADLAASIENLHLKTNQLREQIMVTKAEVLAAIEALKATAAEEKTEVVAAVTEAVAAAVAPLEQVILDLQAQIANGVDLSDVLTAVQSVTEDVEAIIEAAEPVPPAEPAE